ncbi:SWIM zinc finger family protein [Sphaerisporangium sp. NPDC051011]|uniref:SWIM zinc finger family protein n=1 Tax=Sphaerisporangium sp. NPDC051011 TaxID=3155792 RepID=UPI0033F1F99E
MIERWSRDQVLALAPDASSQKGAQSVSTPAKWSATGAGQGALWGECKGSGASPYRACVDFGEPAYRCSCPSRKFPCKHALGLLLLWSADGVPADEAPPAWVSEWLEQRRARAAKAVAARAPERSAAGSEAAGAQEASPGDTAAAERRAAQREERVTTGLSELERWLADQIGQGLSGARQNAPAQWEDLTRRLVDAQAPGVAATVSRLTRVLTEDDWPARLLGEYGLINLLAVGYRRSEELPAPLRDTIRSRVGFPASREEVLAGPAVRDEWQVLGLRDEEQDRLVSRRVWLKGRSHGRFALVLTFAPVGQAMDASLVTGTTIDAELVFYPGASPLRALVAVRHGAAPSGVPAGWGVRGALGQVAAALAGDPWADSWPVLLGDVVPAARGERWLLADAGEGPGDQVEGMPLHPSAGPPWRLLAVSGGHPVTVAAEWTPDGLRPLTTWDEHGQVVVL